MSKELTTPKENQVAAFISQAIEKGLPVETMERLFALHQEAKAAMAREAFVAAMAEAPRRDRCARCRPR